jgi:hypothetical protein
MKRYERKLQMIEALYYEGENLQPERLSSCHTEEITTLLRGER